MSAGRRLTAYSNRPARGTLAGMTPSGIFDLIDLGRATYEALPPDLQHEADLGVAERAAARARAAEAAEGAWSLEQGRQQADQAAWGREYAQYRYNALQVAALPAAVQPAVQPAFALGPGHSGAVLLVLGIGVGAVGGALIYHLLATPAAGSGK